MKDVPRRALRGLKCVSDTIRIANGPLILRPNRTAVFQKTNTPIHKSEIRSTAFGTPPDGGMAAVFDAVGVISASFQHVHEIIHSHGWRLVGKVFLFSKDNGGGGLEDDIFFNRGASELAGHISGEITTAQ